MSLIHELMPKIMADIGAIGKTHRHPGHNYKFRSVEDVLDHLYPVLTKHKVFLSTQVCCQQISEVCEPPPATALPGQSRDALKGRVIYRSALLMTVAFCATDGSQVECMSAGEGIAFNEDKATYKAMSGAFKYAVLLGLCVPLDPSVVDDPDRDGEVTPPAPAKLQPTAPKPATQPPPKPLDRTAESYAKHSAGDGDLCVTEQQRRIGDLCKALGIDGHGLKAILQKRMTAGGSPVQTLEQLTIGQAGEIIAKLQEVCTRKQVPF